MTFADHEDDGSVSCGYLGLTLVTFADHGDDGSVSCGC